jgi:hypothetical protein
MAPDNLDELGLGERATDAVVNRQTTEGDKEAKGFTAGTHITRVKQGFLFWSWGCVPRAAHDPVCALTTLTTVLALRCANFFCCGSPGATTRRKRTADAAADQPQPPRGAAPAFLRCCSTAAGEAPPRSHQSPESCLCG